MSTYNFVILEHSNAALQDGFNAVLKTVAGDKDFYPTYHLAPPTGLLNDPNGLLFDGEKYHLFYQWFPFDALHGMKHWKHFVTHDFHTYQAADDLIPCELFESHGCYSGGALKVGDKLAMFYTGNTRRPSDNQRVPYQNLAIFDLDGKLIDKRPLIENAPAGYTEHVRDPKPYFAPNGKIRFICGAQRENLSGTAIIFEMDNLNDKPRLLGELAVPGFNNHKVFMWECPDLFKLSDKKKFFPVHFSKGMKQKVMIICSFLVEPNLYIIDEPFLGLDPIAINDLINLMCEKRDNGASILMSTHILATAEKYCDNFIIIHEGKILASGKLSDLRKEFNMPEASLDEIYLALTTRGQDE